MLTLGNFSRILENFLVFMKNYKNDFLYLLSIGEKMSSHIPISIIIIIFSLESAISGDLDIKKMKITVLGFRLFRLSPMLKP